MSEEKQSDERTELGEELLGIQGFSAARAKRYRAEMEALLVHRITRQERWSTGLLGTFVGVALMVGGIAMGTISPHPDTPDFGFDAARTIVATTCFITGLVFGGWMLRIALKGSYQLRHGDFMGIFITMLFSGGWAYALIAAAWENADKVTHEKLLLAGVALVLLMGVCLLISFLQRLHRQTQEKLLRIEYHLAELMERQEG